MEELPRSNLLPWLESIASKRAARSVGYLRVPQSRPDDPLGEFALLMASARLRGTWVRMSWRWFLFGADDEAGVVVAALNGAKHQVDSAWFACVADVPDGLDATSLLKRLDEVTIREGQASVFRVVAL